MFLREMKSNTNKGEHGGEGIPRLLKLEHERPWDTMSRVSAKAAPPPAPGQLMEPPMVTYDNKTMAIIMGVVVIVFLVSGFVSMYSRQCWQRRRFRGHVDLTFPMGLPLSSSSAQGRGVNPEIIRSFPTFVYSTVKGRGALACAVCLNEYEDDDTLRLIPRCSHVFHPECIDGWLKSHYTCPLCRANLLVPVAAAQGVGEATPLVGGAEIPDSESENGGGRGNIMKVGRSRTVREEGGQSASTYLMGILFGRSRLLGDHRYNCNSSRRERWERYTLRLEDVKMKTGTRLKRTKSLTFTRMSSARSGYRTRSLGSNHSHSRFFPFHPLTPP